jgi:hypothetical protein
MMKLKAGYRGIKGTGDGCQGNGKSEAEIG